MPSAKENEEESSIDSELEKFLFFYGRATTQAAVQAWSEEEQPQLRKKMQVFSNSVNVVSDHDTEWAREKSQVEWSPWCIGFQSSCYLRQKVWVALQIPPLVPGFGSSNPPPRPPVLNPEMEKALLQRAIGCGCMGGAPLKILIIGDDQWQFVNGVEVLQGRDNHSPVKILLNTMPLDVTQWDFSPASSWFNKDIRIWTQPAYKTQHCYWSSRRVGFPSSCGLWYGPWSCL